MSKDPAVLFYTSDFLSGTQFFTDEQCGQYIRLLCQQHQLGHIPENHMMLICKSYDNPVIKKFIKDKNGLFFNERMESEKEKRIKYCESRCNNRKSKTNKKSYDVTHDNHMLLHMENENDNDNINDFGIKEGGTGETKSIPEEKYIDQQKESERALIQNAQEAVLRLGYPSPYDMSPKPVILPNSAKSVWQSRHSEFIHAGPDEWIPYDFQSGKQWAMLFDCNYNPDGLIFSAIDYKKYCIETKTSGRFVKLPHNWLRDGDFSTNWIDVIEKKNFNKQKQETKEERRERILKELG